MQALDKITVTVELNAVKVLHDQSPIMKNITEEWDRLRGNLNRDFFGCRISSDGTGKEYSDGFASFAARSLEKSFHFFSFLVRVIRFNKDVVKTALPQQCINNTYGYFAYFLFHPYSPRSKQGNMSLAKTYPNLIEERILILTTFRRTNVTINFDCLSGLDRQTCALHKPDNIGKLQNAFVCYVTTPSYLCGQSWDPGPFLIKTCRTNYEKMILLNCF